MAPPALEHPTDPLRYREGTQDLRLPKGSTLVAIGNFDGVHVGHCAVLRGACEQARQRSLRPLVLTFHPHPSEVLGRGFPRLTTLPRKVELLLSLDETLGVVVEPFDAALASLEPEQFVEHLLVERLGAAVVSVGQNFRFGRARRGDRDLLMELGQKYGFEARVEFLSSDADGVYSSTRARAAIERGDLAEATNVLGRPHMLSGEVIEGQRRGRLLGFPTANLDGVAEALPADGVYAVLVDVNVDAGRFRPLGPGVMNLGSRPTMGAGRSIEVHLLDQSLDLYGKRLRVHLVTRLREERRFPDIDALRAQIARDVETARQLLLAK